MKQRKFLLMVLLMLPIMIFTQIDYYSEIQPIFNSNCTNCHTNGGPYQGGLDLTSYDNLMAGNSAHGPVIIPGDSENSILIQKLSNEPPFGDQMPQNGPPYLDPTTIALIAGWISEGALETPDTGEGDIVLSLGDVEVESYATDVVVQANLENTMDDVGGLQFDVIQSPNMLPLTDVAAVGRAEGFDVSFNDFGEGHIRVVLVSIAGGNIEAGDSVILELYYDASDFGSAVVTLSLSGLIVSDPDGNELDASVGDPAIIAVGTNVSLYVEGGTADAGEQVDIAVSLTNSAGVGGLQFDLVDTPNDLTIDAVTATGRAEGFEAEWTEISGALRVILWDPDNGSIAEGDGDIINITATIGDYTHAGDINLSFDNVVVSDDLGGSIWIAELGTGVVTVYPGYLEPPVNLIAESELDGHVPLAWEEPTGGGGGGGGGGDGGGDTIEDAIVVPDIPYMDTQNTDEFSDDYDEVCPYTGSTSSDVVYLWMADPGDYYVSICDSDYDTKLYIYDENGSLAGGCVDANGVPGDCCSDDSCSDPSGNSYRSDLNITIPSAGTYYVIVDGYFGNNGIYNLSIEEGTVVRDVEIYQPPKPMLDKVSVESVTRDRELIGYNIYRSTTSGSGYELLDVVNTGTLEYDDTSVENGSWYFYVVSADYGEMGESGYSNEAAALPAEWVTMSLSNGAFRPCQE